jgi:hypothetical protein
MPFTRMKRASDQILAITDSEAIADFFDVDRIDHLFLMNADSEFVDPFDGIIEALSTYQPSSWEMLNSEC